MKPYLISMMVLAIMLLGAFSISGQDTASGAQQAEALRTQLRDVQFKEAEIQHRLNELDYELKPENIERYFAGVGSTRPEELREHRRKQLQLERDTLSNQLRSLGESRLRLETAITRADSLAYQQSALGSMSLTLTRTWGAHRGLVLGGGVMLVALGGIAAFLLIARRRRSPAV